MLLYSYIQVPATAARQDVTARHATWQIGLDVCKLPLLACTALSAIYMMNLASLLGVAVVVMLTIPLLARESSYQEQP